MNTSPNKLVIPTQILAMAGGTPALRNMVEEKKKTAFIPDSC